MNTILVVEALADISNKLAVIADNTKPKDTDIFQVSKERDKNIEFVKFLVAFIETSANYLELAMGQPDLSVRAKEIRDTIAGMNEVAQNFSEYRKVDDHGQVNETGRGR